MTEDDGGDTEQSEESNEALSQFSGSKSTRLNSKGIKEKSKTTESNEGEEGGYGFIRPSAQSSDQESSSKKSDSE